MNFVYKNKDLEVNKSGTSHFIYQRITAIALIPLCTWFIASMILIISNPKEHLPHYVISSVNVSFLIIFISVSMYHGVLGIRMIIEDYIHCKYLKIWSLMLVYFTAIVSVVTGLVTILSMHILFRMIG